MFFLALSISELKLKFNEFVLSLICNPYYKKKGDCFVSSIQKCIGLSTYGIPFIQ